jgi:hypothetical protein
MVRQLRADIVREQATLTLKDRLGALRQLSEMVVTLGQLTGEAMLNERAILASPSWAIVQDAMLDALSPWPDALTAVAAALQTLRNES